MPWWYIRSLLGPGLHWGRSEAELQAAIARAEREGMPDAAAHLRHILHLNQVVGVKCSERMYPEQEKAPPGEGGANT